ncbi:MAG: MBL fold metallo-hydrolase [Desulfobacterales bacterium]|nr:MBL fold metallo-hydrolase [Desulfobacterales bacterium]
MVIDQPGKVNDKIVLLGRKESCVYLLKGRNEYALLGGGMVSIVPDVLEQLDKFNIDEKKIRRMIILHAHFDHCGIVPFFKKRWPWATVTASARAKELLSSPKIIQSVAFLNQMLLARDGLQKVAGEMGLDFNGIAVESVVAGGAVLRCDDLSLEIIDVPGHSSCSIAVFVKEQKALFASDAGGIPAGDWIFTAANSNFDLYQESLRKMAGYDLDIYLAEHFGALTGTDAGGFLQRSMDAAVQTRSLLEDSYARTGNAEQSAAEITGLLMEKFPEKLLPKEIIALVVGQMFNFIAKQAGKAAASS